MVTYSSRLAILFNRYYSGLATDAETDELMHLIRTSKDVEALSVLIEDAWENLNPDGKEFSEEESEKMLREILQITDNQESEEEPETKVRPLWWLRYAVASVMLLGGIIFYRLGHKPAESPKPAVTELKQLNDILPGGNRALLTLANGTQIVLDSTENGMLAEHGAANFTKTSDGKLAVSATKNTHTTDIQFNTLSTPKGGHYQITLQDGSQVWLNASSYIRFPTVFSDNNRTVEIAGEAYFEVAKETKRPFKVRFANSVVEVLGTRFNIMAYQDEGTSKTTLVEGSVRLSNSRNSKKLRPGQQGSVLSSGHIKTVVVDTDREIAWKNGLFYFKDSGIEEVMREAARWYNVDVSYKGKIRKREFTGKVSRNVNISELLSMLGYAGVNCKIEGKKIVVSM
jgi:transmembrane sensor